MTTGADSALSLSKREHMATAVMAGFAADPRLADNLCDDGEQLYVEEIARTAVNWADHLIEALNKPKGD